LRAPFFRDLLALPPSAVRDHWRGRPGLAIIRSNHFAQDVWRAFLRGSFARQAGNARSVRPPRSRPGGVSWRAPHVGHGPEDLSGWRDCFGGSSLPSVPRSAHGLARRRSTCLGEERRVSLEIGRRRCGYLGSFHVSSGGSADGRQRPENRGNSNRKPAPASRSSLPSP